MNLFDVYPLYDVTPVKAKDMYVYDQNEVEYLDLYGGHGVISIGHSHPHYTNAITEQVNAIGFYSNAIQNPLQQKLATLLGKVSGRETDQLFLCNSGAEAVENALKLASFVTGKSRVIAFKNAFHGRTSAAVSVTDNPIIQAPINQCNPTTFLPLNQLDLLENELRKGTVSAVIIEGIQGVGGLDEGTSAFFKGVERLCKEHEALFIVDEIQSGYGRSGHFFSFQAHDIEPDIITVAKGMGNGFPIAGILIGSHIEAKHGMLGTTFGGNHLACAAAIAVLEVIQQEALLENTQAMSTYFIQQAQQLKGVKQIKGRGLMLGLEFDVEVATLRKKLIYDKHIFTGGATNKNLLRILPPLTIKKNHIDQCIIALKDLV
ncbi:aminotransferase class III-fold pyridoxal phosphate-dependent enzyme [Flavobacteriaceae bacterium F08102]|nr:aminotransferase class III-fold pyridoxal phosphate-dependent enzyme [Flavobacteriaceae bacterium F08102]